MQSKDQSPDTPATEAQKHERDSYMAAIGGVFQPTLYEEGARKSFGTKAPPLQHSLWTTPFLMLSSSLGHTSISLRSLLANIRSSALSRPPSLQTRRRSIGWRDYCGAHRLGETLPGKKRAERKAQEIQGGLLWKPIVVGDLAKRQEVMGEHASHYKGQNQRNPRQRGMCEVIFWRCPSLKKETRWLGMRVHGWPSGNLWCLFWACEWTRVLLLSHIRGFCKNLNYCTLWASFN